MIWLFILACAPDARQQLEFPAQAAPDPVESVTLTRAEAVISDLRLEEPPVVAWSLIPAAYAHPGHDMSGDTIGELLGTWTVDLLGDPMDLGTVTAFEGELATGRVHLDSVLLEGTTPEGVDFSFDVDADSEIAGIPVTGTLVAEAPPQGVVLGINADHMLSSADLETADEDGDGVLTLADGLLENTVTFGVVSTASFSMTVKE